MATILDDFLKYRDDQGLNQNATANGKGITSQNGALFTAQYLICLQADKTTDDHTKYKETERIVDIFLDLAVQPGLSVRYHGCNDYESMDNTTALVAISGLYGDGAFAEEMYQHGEKVSGHTYDTTQDAANNKTLYTYARIFNLGFYPDWFFNNQNPDLFCGAGWFGRSPAMVGLIKMASGKHVVNPIDFIGVLVGQFIGAFTATDNLDARTLSYVAWQFLKERSFFWKMAYKLWCWKLMRDYPRGMRDVYSRYFGESHPIVKYSNNY